MPSTSSSEDEVSDAIETGTLTQVRSSSAVEAFKKAKGRPGSSAPLTEVVQEDLNFLFEFITLPGGVSAGARKTILPRLAKVRKAFVTISEGFEALASKPQEVKAVPKLLFQAQRSQDRRARRPRTKTLSVISK